MTRDTATHARDPRNADDGDDGSGRRGRQWPQAALVLGSLGVVFGDIGTSPLYALREVLGESEQLDQATVLGMTSTMIWSLTLVVSTLYIVLLLRSDNEGEGGLLALVALVRRAAGDRSRVGVAATLLGMFGAAMFLGDSVITPAISVLSAAEGLKTVSPSLATFVLPVALVILAGVFVLQRIGTGGIGKLYGPIMLTWFLLLAVTGTVALLGDPTALQALSPTWAVHFFVTDPTVAFLSLGSVVLVVTGAEAVYADLGHFGRGAITAAWFGAVFPALTLGYLGEAATVLQEGSSAAKDPFYAVVPDWATIPVLVLATLATIIAAQAVIAGAYTVLHQCAGLGMFPYLRTVHTSTEHSGQIYVPAVNWSLGAAVLAVVVFFRSSSALSGAYGLAVSATFVATVSLFIALDRLGSQRFTWRQGLGGVLLVVVLVFVAACLPKFATGGWLPTLIGVVTVTVMWTFWEGRRRLVRSRGDEELSAFELLREVTDREDPPYRVEGTAIFLTEEPTTAPVALRVMVGGNTLHQRVVLLGWDVADTPKAPAHGTSVRVGRIGAEGSGITSVDVTLGYRERLDVRHVLHEACEQERDLLCDVDPDHATYFVSDALPRLSRGCGMSMWRQRLFLVIDRLSTDRVDQLRLPRSKTITVGREVRL